MEDDTRITRIYTGQNRGIPAPEPTNVPECTIPYNSSKILRSTLIKIFEMAKVVYKIIGHVEAYCFILSDRTDLSVTDMLIPKHRASYTSVTVDPSAANDIRDEIRRRNGTIQDPNKKWKAVGWAHSHGNMGVFFSGTDDRNL